MNATESFDQVFRRILEAHSDGYDPWFYRYCGQLASGEDAKQYQRHLAGLLRFGGVDPRGATALDAGCGFGLTTILLRWLGAGQVYGIDISEPMIGTIEAYLPLLPQEYSDRIHVTQGNVTNLPYADGSFDLILSLEAISHYRDVGAFIGEASRVLRKGGALLVRDGNNGRNPRVRRETQALWEEFETGKPSALGGMHERDGTYRLRREEIIRAFAPELDGETLDDLVLRTSLMSKDQVIAAVRDFQDRGALPASYFDGKRPPVDPNSGAVIERLFDPYELATQIRAAGFSTRVAGYWGGASGNPLIRAANTALGGASRLTISTAPSFTIAARRS